MTPMLPTPGGPSAPPDVAPASDNGELLLPDPEVLPNLDELIAMDITPVASIFNEKQQRLLTHTLYSSWQGPGEGRPFLALASVGLFYKDKTPPVYPDVLLSLDVAPPAENLRAKENHSYFLWIVGKRPEAAIEVVSDTRGGEEDYKFRLYARIGIAYYMIFDPGNLYKHGVLRGFELRGGEYEPIDPAWLAQIGLGLKLWSGEFEGSHENWLRWFDREGRIIPTGEERAREAADKLRRLQERMRDLGIDPEA
jgi:hypothetical protein